MKYFDSCQVRQSGVSVELDGWYADSVWEYHLPPDELPAYHDDAARYINRLLRIPPAARKRLKQVVIRCPAKGCLLATIYEFPIFATADDIAAGRGGGFRYLYTGRTSAGAEVWDILNHSCACAQVLYWRAGCRCGTASLDRPGCLTCFPSRIGGTAAGPRKRRRSPGCRSTSGGSGASKCSTRNRPRGTPDGHDDRVL